MLAGSRRGPCPAGTFHHGGHRGHPGRGEAGDVSTVRDGDPPKGSNRDRWLPLVLLALVPFVLLRLGLHPVGDPDTFWHLRAGDHLWGTWQFSGPDPFSRFSTRTWVLHEWLPE